LKKKWGHLEKFFRFLHRKRDIIENCHFRGCFQILSPPSVFKLQKSYLYHWICNEIGYKSCWLHLRNLYLKKSKKNKNGKNALFLGLFSEITEYFFFKIENRNFGTNFCGHPLYVSNDIRMIALAWKLTEEIEFENRKIRKSQFFRRARIRMHTPLIMLRIAIFKRKLWKNYAS